MVKILLINSDLAKNRGDRAITEGIVSLIKERYPRSRITGLSEKDVRDSKWFGISFLKMDTQSLNPFDMLRLLGAARRSDIVLWGGGELLKDYTNKASLWYWVLKMWLVSVVNKNLFGSYQGIGPTNGLSSKKMIRFIVHRCKKFVVRDHESYQKLISWGCDENKVSEAADPAVIPDVINSSKDTAETMEILDISEKFLDNFVAIGPRDWFHYQKSGILPYKYRKKLGLVKKQTSSKKHDKFIKSLKEMSQSIIDNGHNILLVPMHMNEEDTALCQLIKSSSTLPEKVKILDKDTLSPSQLRYIISKARAMVGLRLHTTIIATSAQVPSMTYYYVDKGRAYFSKINQEDYARPIEDLLKDNFINEFEAAFSKLLKDSSAIKKSLEVSRAAMKRSIADSFDGMMRKL